ncbi:iron complex transport system ATP-binding protein [Halopseudomonas litoralis]|uniref:Iron complex transport system ATP-binding protein n=1 Tax=Halopseudomonas litoralis TaxID=797277 RepID=A0A1H1MD22_9GAMM|nr:ABC transporter ATP-binding protein [Halopseudomonas litoralis]SDR84550.1 iron complex transport system ATP-binding protein [Halopseudomonas litoralis]
MDLISIHDLSVGQRLVNVSLNLRPGEMLGVIGANGAGKSTLLHCLAGIQAYRGEIRLADTPLDTIPERQRAQQLGFLPQSSHSAWALSVRDVIALGRLPWGDTDAKAIAQAAAAAQIEDWLERQVDQLSGGQQARVWLARVLAGQPRVLLADEPVASLDLFQQQNVLRLLRRYAHSGRGVMLSIHDLSLAARYCDRLALLHEGQLLALGAPAEVLTGPHLQQAFQVDAHIDLDSDPPIIIPR